MLVSDYVNDWIALRSCGLAARTVDGYKSLLRLYISPTIGHIDLESLSPAAVQRLIADICSRGRARSAQAVYVLLHAALAEAMRCGLLPANPVDRVLRPRHRSAEPQWWPPEVAASMLRACPALRWGHAWALALLCGLRRGEIAGLRWQDIDMRRALLHVRNQRQRITGRGVIDAPPKSASGLRDIPLPDPLLDMLRAERRRQLARQLAGGLPAAYAVAYEDNRPIDPARLDRQLSADLQACGLPCIGLHGLRHSMATAAVAAGVSLRVLQDLLGHAEMSTTAAVYTHIFPAERAAALEDLTALLYADNRR